MEQIAVYIGTTAIYWNSVMIVSGLLAGFFLSYALYTSHSGRGSAMWVTFGIALISGILFSRVVHYWFNREQYFSLLSAVSDHSHGSYFLPCAVFAVWPAALIVKFLGISDTTGEILDAFAPGTALAVAMIRLSHVFSSACRSMLPVKAPFLHFLPFSVLVVNSDGSREYRLATFCISALLMALLSLGLLVFFYRHHADTMVRPCRNTGNVALMFVIFYSAVEIVLDSTRADSTYLSFRTFQSLNKYVSFVSLTQVIAAAALLLVFLHYTRAAAGSGVTPGIKILRVLFAVGLAAGGVSEYLVQRYTGIAGVFYIAQTFGVALMAASAVISYVQCREH